MLPKYRRPTHPGEVIRDIPASFGAYKKGNVIE